jgi:D-alanine--poly(phosphoribitol) ligase subunit 1
MPLTGKRVVLTDRPFAHELLESHAERHPERLALTCGEESRSYGELNAQANQFAHYLIDRGLGPGAIIGVWLDRSIEMVVSILGVLKAGAAYAPLDTTYPAGRLRLMISQLTGMKLVVASPSTLEMTQGCTAEVLNVADCWPRLGELSGTNPVTAINEESICYVIFTSGSTGTPKAVAVRHKGWYNLLNWVVTEFGLGTSSSGLLMSPFGFDITQRGLMTPLFAGAALHLLPSRYFDARMACRLIRDRRVRTLHLAPSALYLLLDQAEAQGADALGSIEFMFPGGEPIVAARLADWAKGPGNSAKLVNVYGVAECTDVASAHILSDYDGYALSGVPIGRPIYNVDIHLLDSGLAPVAPGDLGEICISGLAVGAGYLNDPGLNAERFVSVPSEGCAVALYRTGDLGRVGPDGELMYVGRADRQVKVRGLRVDLGDVEAALTSDERIKQAVVVPVRAKDARDTDLAAFVMLGSEAVSAETFDALAMRRDLLEVLPVHMVPAQIVVVAQFPLSPNGKVDRDALAMRADTEDPT